MHYVSLQRSPSDPVNTDLMSMLRMQTRSQHEELESALGLLAPPLSRDRFLRIIQRLLGFHRIWEPAVAAHEQLRAFHVGRRRVGLLRRDLLALGMGDSDMDQLQKCDAARECAASEDQAMGSLYVMEGSTLGGQIIARALAREGWVPPQGLASFNPYGDNTGRMWREFKLFLENAAAGRDERRIIAGAQQTFVTLNAWLAT
jgi:heme oxygenase